MGCEPFPSPLSVSGLEPLAVGGSLSVSRLILAYSSGIFPWQDNPIVWYSPDPRAVLFPCDFIVSHSLRKSLKNKGFTLEMDTHFNEVMRCCQQIKRKNESSTWISDHFISAYAQLHSLGLAHSFEVYLENELVGGLYGVSLGGVFMGESMFFRVNDASKVAFFYLVEFCKKYGFDFIDAQVQNPHLKSLGVKEISKVEYLTLLKQSLQKPTLAKKWSKEMVDINQG